MTLIWKVLWQKSGGPPMILLAWDHEILNPNFPGDLGLVILSSLTLSLMLSCHWHWGAYHHGWSRLERCRNSSIGALLGLPCHFQALSRPSVMGSVDSFTLSSLTLTLTPKTACCCGKVFHPCRRHRIKNVELAMLTPCCGTLPMPFFVPVSQDL